MVEIRATHKRILVTDDDAAILRLVAAVLQRAGYDVDTAAGGQIALEKIDRTRYDVVVLDLMMPEVDGFDVLTGIARNHSRKRFVVVMSAASPSVIAKANTPNVFATMQKPFQLVDLLNTVDACITAAAIDA